jgi:hypothetical protein
MTSSSPWLRAVCATSSNTTPPTKGLPAKFSALNSVLLDQGIRIGKNQHGIVEMNAMLALVGVCLDIVPLKPDHA